MDGPRWYELCDAYGLYLVAEANLESHGHGFGPASLANQPSGEGHVDRGGESGMRSRITLRSDCRWATRPGRGQLPGRAESRQRPGTADQASRDLF